MTPASRIRGLTLLEVVISLALSSVVMIVAIEFLLGAQRQTTASAAHQRANGESRRLVHLIAREVRGLNLTNTDLEPDTPFDDQSLQYRVVTGFNTATGNATLDPSRASAGFRELRLDGTDIVRITPADKIILASGVSDLRFTLTAPNKLTVAVTVSARDHEGAAVTRRASLTIALDNSTDDAE